MKAATLMPSLIASASAIESSLRYMARLCIVPMQASTFRCCAGGGSRTFNPQVPGSSGEFWQVHRCPLYRLVARRAPLKCVAEIPPKQRNAIHTNVAKKNQHKNAAI